MCTTGESGTRRRCTPWSRGRSESYDEEVAQSRRLASALLLLSAAAAQSHSPPAGVRPARTARGVSILPGGRVIAPLGEQYLTGPEPTALAVSDSGKTIVTANNGSRWRSLSVLQHDKSWSFRHLPADLDGSGAPPAPPPRQDQPWRRIAGGLVVSGEHAVYVAEGNTGRIQFIDLETGERRRVFSIPNAEG